MALGDSMYRLAHGILILFTSRRHTKFTTTLAALPSPPSAAISPHGPSFLLSIHKWSGSFLAEEYRNMFVLLSCKPAMIVGPLILLAILCVSFSANLGNLSSAFFSWTQITTVKPISFIHEKCRAKVSRKNVELAERCGALEQIEHEDVRVQFLSAENHALTSSLVVDQGAYIRTQSALITQLEGQLHDYRHPSLEAVSSKEQHERDARAYRQEVTRLEERIKILVADSNVAQSTFRLNLQSAHACETQLRDTLHANQTLLSEAQAALRTQRQSHSLELGVCANEREHWKAVAEQAETRALDTDRVVLELRKELATAYRNAREAKERFESQKVVLGEGEDKIRSLSRELVNVCDQLRDAEDEIDRLRSDLESVNVWKPLDAADRLRFIDESPSVLKWPRLLKESASRMSVPPTTQRRPRSPDMSLKELECVNHRHRTSIQAYPTPPSDTLSCSTSPAFRLADLGDPFVAETHTQPSFRLGSPIFASREDTTSSSASRSPSPLCTPIIDELREQVAHEHLARVHTENELTLQQKKALSTEAIVVVQHRQSSNQEGLLPTETAHLEVNLAESLTARMTAENLVIETRSELMKAKERYTSEADATKVERDAINVPLSKALPLSSALQTQVMAVDQRRMNAIGTSSDGAESGCSVNLAVSPSMSHLGEISPPSVPSSGSISNGSPVVIATKSELPLSVRTMSSWSQSTTPLRLSTPPATVSCEFGCFFTSETTLSLQVASTSPDVLPSMSLTSTPSSSSVRSDDSLASPHHLTHQPRPEDIASTIPIIGRAETQKARRFPHHASGPYRPKTRRAILVSC